MKEILTIFEQQFSRLHERSSEIIRQVPEAKLYWQPLEKEALFPINSCGEYLLRSAGKIEQTFGGITTKLWDDPFEWTLPEQLSSRELVLEYLGEVEAVRRKGFAFFRSDEDLKKTLPAPVKVITIFQLLLETLAAAENYQGRAIAVFRQISREKLS